MRVFLCLLLLAALLAAQPPDQALERARLLEQVERNLPEAAAAYRALADAPETPPELRATALLRLSVVLEKLGQLEEARAALAAAAETGAGEGARLAAERLAGKGGDELLAARVEVLLADLCGPDSERSKKAAADLRWIGQPGVTYLAAAVEENRQDLSRIATIVPLIFRIGGPDAVAFLDRVLASPDELFRRAVVRETARLRLTPGAALPPGEEGLLRFLQDPSPAVRVEALNHLGHWLTPQELVHFLDDSDREVQTAAIGAIIRMGVEGRQKPEEYSAVIERLVPYLNRALREPKYAPFISTDSFIDHNWWALVHTKNGLEACLLHLEVNLSRHRWDLSQIKDLQIADVSAERIARTASLSRRMAQEMRVGNNRFNLATLLPHFLKTWTRDSLAEVLKIYDEGGWSADNRVSQHAVPPIASWLAEHATAEDYPEIFSRPDLALAFVQSPRFTAKPRPEALLQHLQGLLPTVKEASPLFKAALAVEGPSVGPIVAKWVEERPELFPEAVEALLSIETSMAEEVMSRLLILGDRSNPRHLEHRMKLINRLRYSKLEGLEILFGKAILLFPQDKNFFQMPISLSKRDIKTLTSFGVSLMDFLFGVGGPNQERLHSFTPAQLSTITSMLLKDADPSSWRHLGNYLRNSGRSTLIPDIVKREITHLAIRTLKEAGLADFQAIMATRDQDLIGKLHGINSVFSPFAPGQNLALEDYQELLEAQIEAGLIDLVGTICANAPRELSRHADLLLPLLSTSSPPEGIVRALGYSQETAVFGALEALLTHSSALIRSEAIKALVRIDPGRAVPLLLPLRSDHVSSVRGTVLGEFLSLDEKNPDIQNLERILPFLQDPDSSNVLIALRGFRRHLDARHVSALVELTRSTHEEIRKSAQEILDAIRYYHEQKAFWERWLVHSGLGTSAAEALVRQASPGEEKVIRLAAIASLGTLGDPEALPFLIHLMKDEDLEIAGAAKEAVLRINQRGTKEARERGGR